MKNFNDLSFVKHIIVPRNFCGTNHNDSQMRKRVEFHLNTNSKTNEVFDFVSNTKDKAVHKTK